VEISQQAIDLIIAWEVGEGERTHVRARYEERFAAPHWSGDDAEGLTIGIGYDLRHARSWYLSDWKTRLDMYRSTPDAYQRLLPYVGKIGSREAVRKTRGITIRWEDALAVFKIRRLPFFVDEAKRAFPGVESMGGHVWGALTSLVYHRPVNTAAERRSRKEGAYTAIKEAVAARDVRAIAAGIRAFKGSYDERLPKIQIDLERRREAEARLVEVAAGSFAA
jgi:hypothetical protein